MSGVEILLKQTVASQFAVTRMVGEGKISMQAAFVTNYIIMKSMERINAPCAIPATEFRDAMGIASPAVGYKYVNEAVEAGLLQVIKSAGMTSTYSPRYDNILNGFDVLTLCDDDWIKKARQTRKKEGADVSQVWLKGEEITKGEIK